MSDPRKMFVYGTLRHDLGYRGAGATGTPVSLGTVPGVMFTHGAYPMVVPSDESRVKGQLLSFDDLEDREWENTLRSLDRYEGAPHLFYRDQVEVTLEDGTVSEAWMYFFTDASSLGRMTPVPSGDWADVLRERRP